ncbi:FAD-dependent oxidoreductase [Petroclostridium sp. X23]|uniref:FAD-dependent oxidoreductase n=1 Tax=Petroclostridium sp. X23 TaxID=3045146 RepID=UPI0024ADD84D|nr:FAD-dependent oxidoreductase [Petroclostridium sp. X23]WHH60626.1 FAD-dependent oxidoreductase [Petroclostridium sp. X23]
MLGYYGSYDVVVCGGGTSGVAAAISSARTGAKTLLIERVGQLGGQMNFSGPPGFSFAHLFNARHEQIIGGFAEETHKRLLEQGDALPHILPKWRSHYTFSYVDPDWWGLLVYQMMQENGVELMLHSLVTEVIKDGNDVKGVVVEHPSGRSIVMGKVTIDCTGEGEVCYQAGAAYEIESKDILEPSTVAFTADGVDWDKVLNYIKSNIDEFLFEQVHIPYNNMTIEEIKAEVLKVTDITEMGEIMGFLSLRKIGVETGEWHNQSGVGFFLMPKGGKILAHFQHSSHVGDADCTDVRDITRVEVECRNQDIIAWKFFKKYVPGFENAYIVRVCPEVRIRETRRIMGDYKIVFEDVAEARKFDDVIGKSAFPTGAKHAVGDKALALGGKAEPKDGGSHDIPYRALVPLGLENLLVAGKAISADRPSHHRFLQQTIVTGQAAGVAAALCARDGITPRELENDVKELQKILMDQGAILYGVH